MPYWVIVSIIMSHAACDRNIHNHKVLQISTFANSHVIHVTKDNCVMWCCSRQDCVAYTTIVLTCLQALSTVIKSIDIFCHLKTTDTHTVLSYSRVTWLYVL